MDYGSQGVTAEVLAYVATLPLSSHAIFCYDTEQEAAQVFKSYLQGGVERDEAVHLISDNHDTYASFLQSIDIDVESMEKDRRLRCLLAPELYEDGRLSAAKAVHSATKLLHEDHDLGFKGTRIVSISETYLEISSPSDLLRYEKELGSSFNLPLSALCLYSASRIAERRLDEFLLRLFPAHGVIVGKSMAWDNG